MRVYLRSLSNGSATMAIISRWIHSSVGLHVVKMSVSTRNRDRRENVLKY